MTEWVSIESEGVVVVPDSKDAVVRAMLFAVLRSLVDAPEELELVHVTVPGGIAFQIHCAPSDVGKVIGKKGRTARAIRTILAAISSRTGRRYSMDVAQATIH